jgi:hypothetical protein
VKILKTKTREDTGIPGFFPLLRHHPPHIFLITAHIFRTQTLIGPFEGVLRDINRALLPGSLGHLDFYDPFSITNRMFPHVILRKKINAHLLRIVELSPKIRNHRIGVFHSQNFKTSALFLRHTKQYRPALGVGKGGIGFPKILGKLSLTAFAETPLYLGGQVFPQNTILR